MITPNTDFNFIQVKSDKLGNLYLAKWRDGGSYWSD